MAQSRSNLEITWPLFDEGVRREPIPPDPRQDVAAYTPPQIELDELEQRTAFSPGAEARANAEAQEQARNLADSLPPQAPDWMRAARTLANALEALILQGSADPAEQAAVARTWASWSFAGATESHILRVSHLVSCTYAALHKARQTPPTGAVIAAAAGVLYHGLPGPFRDRMPKERVLLVVTELARQPDAWVALVEGTSELLGWKHYARVHAASSIGAVLARAGKNGPA